MKFTLVDYQEKAVTDALGKLTKARQMLTADIMPVRETSFALTAATPLPSSSTPPTTTQPPPSGLFPLLVADVVPCGPHPTRRCRPPHITSTGKGC